MKKTNELGKFIVVVSCILGLGVGTIFFFEKYWLTNPEKSKLASSQSEVSKKTVSPSSTFQHAGMGIQTIPVTTATASVPAKSPTKQVESMPQFSAVLNGEEYVARYFKDGTAKEIAIGLSRNEVKNLLGNPDSEGYEDGESRYQVYRYGHLSIYFDDIGEIEWMLYEGKDKLLKEKWFLGLKRTIDTDDADFYQSPTKLTELKVDHLPQEKKVYLYLQKNYPHNRAVVQQGSSSEQTQLSTPKPAQTSFEQTNGAYVVHPGATIDIDTLAVKNSSKMFTKKYRINVNYHFAYNNDNWVKVITNPDGILELMAGEEGAVHIQVKASSHAPKGTYRYIVSVLDGTIPIRLKEFVVEVK